MVKINLLSKLFLSIIVPKTDYSAFTKENSCLQIVNSKLLIKIQNFHLKRRILFISFLVVKDLCFCMLLTTLPTLQVAFHVNTAPKVLKHNSFSRQEI